METPKISVLMVVNNAAHELQRTLESILHQEFPHWEMVVVSKRSTNAAWEILKGFAARDGRIRLMESVEGRGTAACLNQGLRECRGEWIARQSVGDLSASQRFAVQLESLKKREAVLLGTQGEAIDREGRKIGLLDVAHGGRGILWATSFVNPFINSSVVFRRDVALKIGGYDESFRVAQDYELWTRMAKEGRVANLRERLVGCVRSKVFVDKTERDIAFAEEDKISEREVRLWLGRAWVGLEGRLVSDFRRGLASLDRQAFWLMLHLIEEESGVPMPKELKASWVLKMAETRRYGIAAGLLSVVMISPKFAWEWISDRYFSKERRY